MKHVKKLLTILLTVCMLIGFAPMGVMAAGDENSSVSYTAAWNDDGTAITLTVEPDSAGTVYYSVQEATDSAPLNVAENEAACVAGTNTFTISQSTQTAKSIYVSYIDSDGNQYATTSMELGAYGTGTEVTGGPSEVIEKGTITVEGTRLSATSVSLTATSTVDGNLYYVLKPSAEEAPSDEATLSGTPVELTADTPVSFTITSVSSDELTAYFRFSDADGNVYSETTTTTIPAYTTSTYSAEVESYNTNLRTVAEGYDNSDIYLTITITNTGEETLSFSVDTDDSNYATFSTYFTVDTTNAQNIAAGDSGTVKVTPVSGLTAGTYSSSFVLEDVIDDSNTLTLGPNSVTLTVAETGDSTSDVTIPTEYPYSPYRSEITGSGLINYDQYMIGTDVVYCANYHYTLGSDLFYYTKKYGLLSNVTNKVLDSYTGLDPNADPLVYPPNNYGYVPVKTGLDNSTVRDNVARVLYYGYPNDALNIGPAADGSDQNYNFAAQVSKRKRYAFMIATQCAIWHYTDGIDYSDMQNILSTDQRIQALQALYPGLAVWVWADAQNLYNLLIGNSVSSRFNSSITLDSVSTVPSDFQVDLYVADNPVNYPGYGALWSQNLVTGRVATTSTDTIDIPVTKVWQDGGDVENRPSSITVVLYQNGTATTNTLTLGSSNNWTGSFTDLNANYTYTIQEVSVDGYTSEISGSQAGGFTITNTSTDMVDVAVSKEWIGTEGDSITVNLLADNTVVSAYRGTVIEADDNGNFSYTFTDLPRYNSNGNEISYSVVETATDGDSTYQSIVTGGQGDNGDYDFTITNSNRDTTSLTVMKKWIGTVGNSATVRLYQMSGNGTKTLIGQRQITADNGWTYTFTGLSTYDGSGDMVSYTVEEVGADGYEFHTSTDDNGNVVITNVETTDISVRKEWVGEKGEYAEVNLLQDGEVKDTVRLNEDNGWTYTWNDLAKYDYETGNEITYTVSENTDDYVYTVTEDGNGGFVITNSPKDEENTTEHHEDHEESEDSDTSETTNLKVYKKWAEGLQQEAVVVQLLRNGVAVEGKLAVLSEENGWYYNFDNLPKKDGNGNAYAYSVQETGGKWLYVLSANSDGSITITNTGTTEVSSIESNDTTAGGTSAGVTQTGDSSNIAIHFALFAASAAVILISALRKRRNH